MDYVFGASSFVATVALNEVGVLDDDYFLYSEDVDWCLRARRAGWSLAACAASKVWHKGGQTTGHDSPDQFYYAVRNSLRVMRRYYPAWLLIAFPYRLLGNLVMRTLRGRAGRASH